MVDACVHPETVSRDAEGFPVCLEFYVKIHATLLHESVRPVNILVMVFFIPYGLT